MLLVKDHEWNWRLEAHFGFVARVEVAEEVQKGRRVCF